MKSLNALSSLSSSPSCAGFIDCSSGNSSGIAGIDTDDEAAADDDDVDEIDTASRRCAVGALRFASRVCARANQVARRSGRAQACKPVRWVV